MATEETASILTDGKAEAVSTNGNGKPNGHKETAGGLAVERRFTRPGENPFDLVDWELRKASISGDKGETVFEQKEVEVPKFWSQLATNVVVSKYFRGPLGTPQRERSVRQMIGRVSDTITEWGRRQGYFATDTDAQTFHDELTHIILHQKATFNSPVWFNMGVEPHPQCSACQPYHALVSTPEGMIPIGQLVDDHQIGQMVYDAHGITRVLAVKHNGYKPVYRVRLRNGNFIEATPDHLVRAVSERRSRPTWLRVDQLREGMRLHLHPHRAKIANPVSVAAASDHFKEMSDSGSGPFELDYEDTPIHEAQAALAGWLQADGFAGQYEHGTNTSLTIEFIVANDDEYEWIIGNLDLVFGDIHRHVREVETEDPNLRVRRIRLYGEKLRDFVEEWELLKRGTDMRVPSRLWTASSDEIAAYLRSVFQAEGYITNQRDRTRGYERSLIGMSVIGEKWTEDIQLLLNTLGIYSRRLYKHDDRPDQHDTHEIRICIGSERARFAEFIGFISREKQEKLHKSLSLPRQNACPDLREEAIVKIEFIGTQEVYDIQTESGEYLSNNIAVHNCFILAVDDSMESILEWCKTEGMIFKGGSGAGVNLSKIRSSKEYLSAGGQASGPVSFMRAADSVAGSIKSGGKTRRAAKMVVLDVDHPDVVEFIWCKANEEKKAYALGDAGWDMSLNGDAWSSIQFQNANNSVRVSQTFLDAVDQDKEWELTSITTGKTIEKHRARDMMRWIAEAAWQCGDPGMQYDTTINDWHTCSNTDRINASNPCSEYMHLDNSACNLASINLLRYLNDDGVFDVDGFKHTVDVMIMAQDIIVNDASYPTEKIGVNARAFRQLGLGYANLGALLMALGLPYDSEGGRAYTGAITALMTGRAYRQSAAIAGRLGPFEGYAVNREPMIRVIGKHREAVNHIDASQVEKNLLDAARVAWDEALEIGKKSGYRNAQATVLAPTGTIAFMMDCDTTGIEPDIALVKYKRLVGGGTMKIVNRTVLSALKKLGYSTRQMDRIVAYINENGTIEGAPELKPEHLPVFDCAFRAEKGTRSIHYMGHIKMMAAAQPFISGAISKTVNLPNEATEEDIMTAYLEGGRLGLKALAIYRDGSKKTQPLSTKASDKKEEPKVIVEARPIRRRLPDERQAITHKFSIAGHEGYLTVGLFEDGTPGEIFLRMSKEGSTVSGMMDAFATAISVALQYGVPLESLVRKFSHMRFEPAGFTTSKDVPIAKSIMDYIFRWLAVKFLPSDQQPASNGDDTGLTASVASSPNEAHEQAVFVRQADAPSCPDCGSLMTRNGSCYVCRDCGTTSGCS